MAMAIYVLVKGLGARSSKRVPFGLSTLRIKPIRTERLRVGTSGVSPPRDVTMQTGASKPGFKRFSESVVAETKGIHDFIVLQYAHDSAVAEGRHKFFIHIVGVEQVDEFAAL